GLVSFWTSRQIFTGLSEWHCQPRHVNPRIQVKSFLVERFISTLLLSFKTQVGIHAHDKQNIELLQKLHSIIETYLDNGMLDLQRIPESLKDDLNFLINNMARYESYIYELAQEDDSYEKKVC
ncbi:hypothetical protein SAMN02910275_00823, partial [Butyrivibrio sp. INlla18]|uniref:hypothetical protein n=1 Tax=Butyrivibrio sp. INlla18 TaxID=1520806 RepID=UPI00088968AA